jgi:hypothetical protein
MPSPQPTNRPGPDGPTAKQLRWLRRLAHISGQTFTHPTTKSQASAEIRRLTAITRQAPSQQRRERRVEPERLRNTVPPPNAAAVREDEITGYGAHARWTHRHQDRGGQS